MGGLEFEAAMGRVLAVAIVVVVAVVVLVAVEIEWRSFVVVLSLTWGTWGWQVCRL